MEGTQDGTSALPEAQDHPKNNRRREGSGVRMVGLEEVAQKEESRLDSLLP